MARKSDFYQGRRQRRNYWLIPFIILIGLLTLLVVLFYGLQKYAVISDDKVKVVFAEDGEDAESGVLSTEESTMVFDSVVPEIVFQPPDYSRVAATAGRNVKPLRAVYISATELSEERLQNAADVFRNRLLIYHLNLSSIIHENALPANAQRRLHRWTESPQMHMISVLHLHFRPHSFRPRSQTYQCHFSRRRTRSRGRIAAAL